MKFSRYNEAVGWKSAGKLVTPKARALVDEQAASARFHEVMVSNNNISFCVICVGRLRFADASTKRRRRSPALSSFSTGCRRPYCIDTYSDQAAWTRC